MNYKERQAWYAKPSTIKTSDIPSLITSFFGWDQKIDTKISRVSDESLKGGRKWTEGRHEKPFVLSDTTILLLIARSIPWPIVKPTSVVDRDRCIPWCMSAMSHMFPPLSRFPGAVNSQVSGSPLWVLCWANLGLLKSLHLIPDREASHVKLYFLGHRTIGPGYYTSSDYQIERLPQQHNLTARCCLWSSSRRIMSQVVSCLITLLLLALSYRYVRRPALYAPGPKRLPIAGNAFNVPSHRPWVKFASWSRIYGERPRDMHRQSSWMYH